VSASHIAPFAPSEQLPRTQAIVLQSVFVLQGEPAEPLLQTERAQRRPAPQSEASTQGAYRPPVVQRPLAQTPPLQSVSSVQGEPGSPPRHCCWTQIFESHWPSESQYWPTAPVAQVPWAQWSNTWQSSSAVQ
jgi:hypothetical protein